MGLKFRRGNTAQKSGSLAFGEPYVNTDLNTLMIGGASGDITLATSVAAGAYATTGSNTFTGDQSITGSLGVTGNLTLGGNITIGDNTSDTLAVTANLSSSLIPQTTNVFDIGSASKIYRNIYGGIISGSALEIMSGSNAEFRIINKTTGIQYHLQNGDLGHLQLHNAKTDKLVFRVISGSASDANQTVQFYGGVSVSQSLTSPSIFGTEITGSTIRATTGITGSIAATNGVVSGSSQVVGILTSLNTFSASIDTKFTTLQSLTASTSAQISRLQESTASLNAFSASENTKSETLRLYTASIDTKFSTLATYTGSNDTTNTTQNTRLTRLEEATSSLNSLTGSYARTNSTNTFTGNQTITGSLFISQDLIVQGSSSIQNISSSRLDIGDNIIQLNVNQPALRFGGLAIFDSGSAGGSGSFLYDAVEDEFIFVHKGNGTNVTSSHFITGPETYDNLGNETYLTINRLPKATGKEHIVDSNITDTGALITLGSNTVVNGTLVASGTSLVSSSAQIAIASVSGYDANKYVDHTGVSITAGNGLSGGGTIAATRTLTLDTTSATFTTGVTTQNNALGVVSGSRTISGITLGSNLATLTIGTGLSGTSYNGSTGVTIANTGVLSVTTNTGLSTNASATGNITITNTGVTSAIGTSNQISVSGATGAVTFSLPQSIATSSNVQFNSIGVGVAASATAGRIDAANDIVAFSSSDIRFKENIKPIENALQKISKISGNTYDWKAENKIEHGYEGNDVGVIAQEIEEVLPQLVQTRENGYKAVKYDKLVALLIEGIKEQQTQIHSLTIEIEKLKESKGL